MDSDQQEKEVPGIPLEILKQMVDALAKYKTDLIQAYTSQNQNSERVTDLRDIIIPEKGRQIQGFLKCSMSYTRDPADTQLNALLLTLRSIQAEANDPRISTELCEIVEKLFIQVPLTPNIDHIISNLEPSQK